MKLLKKLNKMKKKPREGIFITIEGPDGSGKDTQIDLLVTYLRLRGHSVLITREPGGTPVGEKIREILLKPVKDHEFADATELLLFAAGRAQHVCEKIVPAISQGQIVVASRYIDASVAYQGYGRGLPLEMIDNINEFATGGLKPDLTIILDIDSEEGLNRARTVKKETPSGEIDRIEAAGLAFHNKVRNGYLEIAKNDPDRCCVVDGSHQIVEVSMEIEKCVNLKFEI